MCWLDGQAAGSLDGDQMNFPQRSGSKAPKPWLLESRDLHSMLLAAGLWVWGQCRSGKGRNYRWPSAAPQTSLASASEDQLMVSTSSLSSLLFQAVVGAATESCASLEASWKLRMEALASWLAFSWGFKPQPGCPLHALKYGAPTVCPAPHPFFFFCSILSQRSVITI